jgi:DNA-binding NtrC family response regulator
MMNSDLGTILLVDDDSAFRQAAGRALERRGYVVLYAESGEEAMQIHALADCDAAVVDLRMPGMDGLELVKNLRSRFDDLPVIVLTGHGAISTAIDSIKLGAFHYLTKPCEISELDIYLKKAIESRRLRQDAIHLRDAIHRAEASHGIIGESPVIRRLLEVIERVKDADAPVLVAGESGTGKELVARALHFQSRRKEFPFVALNCATLKPELLENELFGHVSGAFTGAVNRKIGLFAVADKGTLFIDEIVDMDPNVQAGLLRVIETGEYRPLGSTKEKTTNARVIVAANRDLAAQVREKKFREDLFYRLNVIVIQTPPLRTHLEDIPCLIEAFLARAAVRYKGVNFSDDALKVLQSYHWPGNVRELFNICERAVLLRNDCTIPADEIESLLYMTTFDQSISPKTWEPSSLPASRKNELRSLEDIEREHIQNVMESVNHNVSRAAEILGIDRRTLQRKMERYGLREYSDRTNTP